jgi:hypothetical protein
LGVVNGAVQTSAAIKLKAQSMAPILERCKEGEFVDLLLGQEPHIDAEEFKKRLVESVSPGSPSAQINTLLDLVAQHGHLASVACRQLAVVFQAAGEVVQLHIVQLLLSQLESGSKV